MAESSSSKVEEQLSEKAGSDFNIDIDLKQQDNRSSSNQNQVNSI